MKHGLLCLSLLTLALPAFSQVTLDGFEGGVNAAEWTIAGFGSPAAQYTVSGAASTTAAMVLQDNGFSFSATKTYTAVVPTSGNYKVTFFYQNGHENLPMAGLKIQINDVERKAIANGAVTTWTAVETDAFAATAGSNIKFAVVAANGTENVYKMLIDEIKLEPVANLPIQNATQPLNGTHVAGNVVIQVTPSGGSGTFSSVSFDIGNNGSVEHTDSTSGDGFTYNWNTSAGADGAVQVKIVTTDNTNFTGERIVTYTVDNAKGRETLFSSDFETWSGGIPNGWTRVDYDAGSASTPAASQPTPVAVISEETANPFAGSKSLHINYPANPDPHRYTIRSTPFAANRNDYQVSFAYRGGSFTRLAYFQSADGVAWRTTGRLFDPSATAVWGEGINTAYNLGVTSPSSLPQSLAIVTHFFGTGDLYIDNVKVAASVQPVQFATAAENWELFE